MGQRERERTDETPAAGRTEDGAATDETSVPGATYPSLPKVPGGAPSLLDPEEERPVPTEPRAALSSDTMVMDPVPATSDTMTMDPVAGKKPSDTMVMDPVDGAASTTDDFSPPPSLLDPDDVPVPTDTRPAMSKADAAAVLFVNPDEVPTDSMSARPPPPRTQSGQIRAQGADPKRTRSGTMRAAEGGVVPKRARTGSAPAQTDEMTGPKRPPTGSVPAQTDEVTGPKRTRSGQMRAAEGSQPRGVALKPAQMPGEVAPVAPRPQEPFKPGPVHVAIGAGAVAALFLLVWLVWPAMTREPPPPPVQPPPLAVALPPKPLPELPKPEPAAPALGAVDDAPTPVAEAPNEFRLDAKVHTIEPLAVHAPDVGLNASHKYKLSLKTKDEDAAVVLVRLDDESNGWGVLNRLATGQPFFFGGAKALRLHCEPGTVVKAETTVLLELQDLARRTDRRELSVKPAQHCWDFEVARPFPLSPGAPKRVRLPPEQTAVLGQQVPLRVAWQVQTGDSPPTWRAGVLAPGDDVLLDGVSARLAVLDPWRGDNEGYVKLEILDGDIDARGLVRPGKR